MELDSVLTATLVYDLVAVALLSASTVTYNDRGQDAAFMMLIA